MRYCTRTHLPQALYLVSPLAGELDGRLDSLGTSVHQQSHLEASHLGEKLGEGSERRSVEGTGRQSELLGLSGQCVDNMRVAVA